MDVLNHWDQYNPALLGLMSKSPRVSSVQVTAQDYVGHRQKGSFLSAINGMSYRLRV